MNSRWGFFVLGVATGLLGAKLYEQLQGDDFDKKLDAVRDRLNDSVKTLEDRIGAIIDLAGGDLPAT